MKAAVPCLGTREPSPPMPAYTCVCACIVVRCAMIGQGQVLGKLTGPRLSCVC